MTYALVLAFAFVLPLLAGIPVVGADLRAPSITPLAMQAFCHRWPEECRAAPDGVAEWTPHLVTLLNQTNTGVNQDIGPRADPGGDWEIEPAFGDCNDYVLTKRSRLIRLGVPPGALRVAITTTRSGTAHAILVVRTSAGDIVLDNLNGTIKTLAQSGYVLKAISTANPRHWARL